MNEYRQKSYIPALKYHALTGFYDTIVRITTREMLFKKELIDVVGPQGGEYILDVGCGTGTLTLLLAERDPKLRIKGLDADPAQLSRANSKSVNSHSDISFEQGYAQQLADNPETFDVVVSSLFFHHLTTSENREALADIFFVLKPGGRLCIADWGEPSSIVQRYMFLLVQCLDGFETTQDSVTGMLPELIKGAEFTEVECSRIIPTLLGTVRIFQAKIPL